ncbi:hypothetical protein DSO57_1009550 [Entomophthora muscae]|uniref:Uncharacterized protein n=1 Tax=Entomophthora muscae TaxID=34485 RepID=A0ACC2S8M1_9FUNG|nr:hypothetical protein DSO57_1009550 [Entomophthora muscae]
MKLIFFSAVVGFHYDPCAQIAYKRVSSYAEAMACYQTFSLQEKVKSATLQSLRRAIPLVSLNHNHSSMLKSALEVIEKEPFEREFDFHNSLVDLYAKGNMKYDAGCFSSFTFHLPLELVIEQENHALVVRVPNHMRYSSSMLPHWQSLGFVVSKLSGRRVLKIDSQDAVSYLLAVAKSQGSPHIASTLSRSMFEDGRWIVTEGSFAARKTPPPTKRLLVEFEDGEVMDLPFLASVPAGFHDSMSFYKNMCTLKNHRGPTPGLHGLRYKSNSKGTSHVKLVTADNNAILTITSFEDTAVWESEIHRALMYLLSRNIGELVLDLRDSGGHHVCGSYQLAEYLFPRKTIPRFPYVLPNAPLIKEIMKDCLQAPHDCTDIPIFSGNSNCGTSFLKDMPLHFNSSKTKIITNGLCEGACAILVHALTKAGVADLHFVGPPGIQPILGSSGISYSLKKLNQFLERKPQLMKTHGFPFYTDVDLTFTLGQPLEMNPDRVVFLNEVAPAKAVHNYSSDAMVSPLVLWQTVLGVKANIPLPDFF